MSVVVFGSLGALSVAIVVLCRTVFDQGAQLSALSLQKPFYLCEVEKGARGICRVIPIGAKDHQQHEREPESEPDDGLMPVPEDFTDPTEVQLDSRE